MIGVEQDGYFEIPKPDEPVPNRKTNRKGARPLSSRKVEN